MKVTLVKIYQSNLVIKKLVSQEMPANIAFRIGESTKVLEEKFGEIEKQRISLVEKYGEPKDGKTQVKEDKIQDFVKEWGDLLKEETDIEIKKVPLNCLPDTVSLTPAEMRNIDFLFENN